MNNPTEVTPFVGVWIETYEAIDRQNSFKSHPSWVCGLKLRKTILTPITSRHTLRGCVD